MRISLPAKDKNFSFHPFSFFHTRFLRAENSVVLLLPITAGSPKYFPGLRTTFASRTPWTSLRCNSPTFGLKKISDFSIFIRCPEGVSYLVIASLMASAFLLFARAKITVSSAKKRWVSMGAPRQIRIPSIALFDTPLRMRLAKASAHMIKR
ncbi:hypothetical protein RND81_05G231600 [Saponaria officinalis]|uniref:Uncharacterized protein n=1 Tax=Saponaria officinalis TaxID=3572 RepID=A0AAW1L2G7_SAPOF